MGSRDTVVGVDIGQDSVKAAWVKGGSRPQVIRVESFRVPPTATDRVAAIRPWVAKMGIERASCVLGVRGPDCMFQPLFLTEDDPRTPEQASAVEVSRFGEMSEEEMVYGFSPFANAGSSRRLLLVMARPSLLHEILANAKALSLNVVDMIPGAAAMYRAAQFTGDVDEQPALFLNVGASITELAVGTGQGLMFARSFAGGGQMFTDALARERQMLPSRAETLKTGGTGLVGETPMAAAMRSAGDMWLAELESCLTVYRTLFAAAEDQPQRVVLCGGGAKLAGLPEAIEARIGIPAGMMKPLGKRVPDEDAPLLITAAGLALCGADAGGNGLALLPQGMRDELVFRRQKPFWIAAGIVAALILGVSLVGGFRDFKRKEAVLKVQNESLQRRQNLVSQIEQVRAAADEIVAMAEPIEKMLLAGPHMRDLITLVAESLAGEDRITMICDAESYFTGRPKEDRKQFERDTVRRPDERSLAAARKTFERIVIEGYTRKEDFSLVKDLIAKLSASDLVISADLLSDDKLVSWGAVPVRPPPGARAFVLDVELRGVKRDEA